MPICSIHCVSSPSVTAGLSTPLWVWPFGTCLSSALASSNFPMKTKSNRAVQNVLQFPKNVSGLIWLGSQTPPTGLRVRLDAEEYRGDGVISNEKRLVKGSEADTSLLSIWRLTTAAHTNSPHPSNCAPSGFLSSSYVFLPLPQLSPVNCVEVCMGRM